MFSMENGPAGIITHNAGHPLLRIVADYLLTSRKCFER